MRTLLLIVLVLTVWVAAPRVADACSCARPDIAEGAKSSAEVVRVQIIRREPYALNPDDCKQAPDRCLMGERVIARVMRVWKGDPPTTLAIDTNDQAMCGFGKLGPARDWLLLVTLTEDGRRTLHLCSGSQPWSAKVGRQVKRTLGAGKPARRASKP